MALLGFTRHNDKRFDEAERNFDAALAAMPVDKRCMWEDLGQIFNDVALASYYSKRRCADRGEVNDRIWWLADPMWIVPGNDRRTEHYSRWVTAELQRLEAELLGWRRFDTHRMHDLLNALLRLGRAEVYAGVSLGCSRDGRLDCGMNSAWGSEDRYLPRLASVLEPFSASVMDFQLAQLQGGFHAREYADVLVPRWTRNDWLPGYTEPDRAYGLHGFGEVYRTPFGKGRTIPDAQTAIVLRGDSVRLLSAFSARDAAFYLGCPGANPPSCPDHELQQWQVPSGRGLQINRLLAGLAVSAAPGVDVAILTREASGSEDLRFALDTKLDSALVSLEARTLGDIEYSSFARHRFAVFRPELGATSRVRSSDMVLYDAATGARPASADSALQLMLPRSTVRPSEQVGFYWELYGLKEGDVPDIALAAIPLDSGGFFKSLARSVGLASAQGSRVVSWTAQPVTAADIGAFAETPFSLLVDLSSLKDGMYLLELTTKVEGDSAVYATKEIRVKR
jgi:hypothetical protein